MTTPTEKCKDRIKAHLDSRLSDLKAHQKAMATGLDETPDLGSIGDYGLCFDYVAAGTYPTQREGYFRWQISWGGPSDEFRFYADAQKKCHRIEYWFMDWYAGAKKKLSGKNEDLLLYFFEWFVDVGVIDNALKEATK